MAAGAHSDALRGAAYADLAMLLLCSYNAQLDAVCGAAAAPSQTLSLSLFDYHVVSLFFFF